MDQTCQYCGIEFCPLGTYIKRTKKWVIRGTPRVFCSNACNKNHGYHNRRRNGAPSNALKFKKWLRKNGFKSQWEYEKSLPTWEDRQADHKARTLARQDRVKHQYDALSLQEKADVRAIYREMQRLNRALGCIWVHVDHIIPVSKGGAHHASNLQILPAHLNMKKGSKIE